LTDKFIEGVLLPIGLLLLIKKASPFSLNFWKNASREISSDRLLKNSYSVIPECFIGNPVLLKSTSSGFPLSRE
jgi:hypothetical protein